MRDIFPGASVKSVSSVLSEEWATEGGCPPVHADALQLGDECPVPRDRRDAFSVEESGIRATTDRLGVFEHSRQPEEVADPYLQFS